MNEKPILFSTEMVQALLSGRKTQTRRVFKLPPKFTWEDYDKGLCSHPDAIGCIDIGDLFCRYGSAGDGLWVRETWDCDHLLVQKGPYLEVDGAKELLIYYASLQAGQECQNWKPSIHMPRWASRINLTITNTRVGRLQSISDEDAIAEGLQIFNEDDANLYYSGISEIEHWPDGWQLSPVQAYRDLWIKINGAASWDANPWVDVVEFAVREVSHG